MAISKTANVSSVQGALGGKKIFASTAFPTSGDFEVGDRVWDTTPSASNPDGWIVTRAGSIGTFASRTGTITQSSFALTVNSALGVNVGSYVLLAGMTGSPKVTAINRTTKVATLDLASDATVTAGALTYQAPSYVRMANGQAS
jgi:hypothetical protein